MGQIPWCHGHGQCLTPLIRFQLVRFSYFKIWGFDVNPLIFPVYDRGKLHATKREGCKYLNILSLDNQAKHTSCLSPHFQIIILAS